MNWYLDACSLLNLCATGCVDELVVALDQSMIVLPSVYPGELSYLYSRTESGERGERQPLEINGLFEAGILVREADPHTPEELERYVLYAALVDDGEAATLAAAECRGGGLVSDDRGAIKVIAQMAPQLPCLTTFHILKRWMETGVPVNRVKRAVQDIEIRARCAVSPRHPLFDWIRDLAES